MLNLLKSAPENDFIWAFSRRAGGNMSLYYGDTQGALDNREGFLKGLNIDYRELVCAKQAHGDHARYVTKEDSGKGAIDYDDSVADTDAFITDTKNIPLAIFTADCLAVFLYDPHRPAIGLAHAGWRGTKENLAAKAIRLMQKHFDSRPSSLNISFGPAIRGCCYEVKKEFSGTFGPAVIKRGGRYYLDLAEVNRKQLLEAGVKEENIFDPKLCTFCGGAEYFSFRREGDSCGRMMAVAMLK